MNRDLLLHHLAIDAQRWRDPLRARGFLGSVGANESQLWGLIASRLTLILKCGLAARHCSENAPETHSSERTVA